MKKKYKDINFSKPRLERLAQVNEILERYQQMGYVLTLRQVYYRLVKENIIPNNEKEYDKLGVLLTDGRMAGIVDWDAIEDRVRTPHILWSVTGIAQALNDVARQYRLNRMEGQGHYIELWVEKDALSSIFKRVTEPFHIKLMVNRGYSSCSAMYQAAERFRKAERNGQLPVILYFGDHDPSGLDMVRDVRDRLETFGVEVEVNAVALNMAQIKQYDLDPNPAKLSDSRAPEYIAKHGYSSWELDAIDAPDLESMAREALEEYLDMDVFAEMEAREWEDVKKIKESIRKYFNQ